MDAQKKRSKQLSNRPCRRELIRVSQVLVLGMVAGYFTSGCSLGQRRFSSPEEAAAAFTVALRADDSEELLQILGRGSKEIISSGDEIADRSGRERFLDAYDENNSLAVESDGSVTLQVGNDDWPMPIPIVKHWGAWRFDTRRGANEILNRRVGRNELSTRDVCLAIVDAQLEFEEEDRNGDGVREYAQHFFSSPAERNGLYWETAEGEPPSPLGPLAADAAEEGYATTASEGRAPQPFHGYYFKLLKAQGSDAPGGARDYMKNGKMTEGFAVVAWPAEYGNSGVMTFLVSHQGVVYERDLGENSAQIASEMSAFDPDPQWNVE